MKRWLWALHFDILFHSSGPRTASACPLTLPLRSGPHHQQYVKVFVNGPHATGLTRGTAVRTRARFNVALLHQPTPYVARRSGSKTCVDASRLPKLYIYLLAHRIISIKLDLHRNGEK